MWGCRKNVRRLRVVKQTMIEAKDIYAALGKIVTVRYLVLGTAVTFTGKLAFYNEKNEKVQLEIGTPPIFQFVRRSDILELQIAAAEASEPARR